MCIRDRVDPGPAEHRHRGVVDDRPGMLAHHHRQHMVAGQVGALEVHRHQPVPGRLVEFGRAADHGDADVVDQDVDPPVGLQGARHQPLDIGAARHVADHGDAAAAFLVDDPLGGRGGGGVDVQPDHLRPLAGKQHRHRLAVAPALSLIHI